VTPDRLRAAAGKFSHLGGGGGEDRNH
jgi:hypothetical protein